MTSVVPVEMQKKFFGIVNGIFGRYAVDVRADFGLAVQETPEGQKHRREILQGLTSLVYGNPSEPDFQGSLDGFFNQAACTIRLFSTDPYIRSADMEGLAELKNE